jgi:TRAP-type uncharacterized transport system fused permease subunit
VAGGIEAASSTGWMFMPPVMGAGAFLMAEMLHISYAEVAKIALVPALLYFFAVFAMVHVEALRTGIGTVPPEERMDTWAVFKGGWYYMAPFIVLFYMLFFPGAASRCRRSTPSWSSSRSWPSSISPWEKSESFSSRCSTRWRTGATNP